MPEAIEFDTPVVTSEGTSAASVKMTRPPVEFDTPAETPEEAAVTLAESGAERDEQGRFKPEKHRASSQKATADDVAEIAKRTKTLRELEQQAGERAPEGRPPRRKRLNGHARRSWPRRDSAFPSRNSTTTPMRRTRG